MRTLCHLEEQRVLYAIRFPNNQVLQWEIPPLLRRSVGRPPRNQRLVLRILVSAWALGPPRRLVTKVEWRHGA